jgi:hypothetical protein
MIQIVNPPNYNINVLKLVIHYENYKHYKTVAEVPTNHVA